MIILNFKKASQNNQINTKKTIEIFEVFLMNMLDTRSSNYRNFQIQVHGREIIQEYQKTVAFHW